MTIVEKIKQIKISRLSPFQQFMIKNNLTCIFVGTGLTYYKQCLGANNDILYLKINRTSDNYIVYNETNSEYFNEYNNSKYLLNKYGLKTGDKLYFNNYKNESE